MLSIAKQSKLFEYAVGTQAALQAGGGETMTKASLEECPGECTALSTESRTKGSDGPLEMVHFPCVWRLFQKQVRYRVGANLFRAPLAQLCRQLRNATADIFCRNPEAVRYELMSDRALIEDLVQDVALAMIEAIRREKLCAARAAIYKWIERATYRIVKDRIREAALQALTGTVLVLRDDEEMTVAPLQPLAGLDGAAIVVGSEFATGATNAFYLRDLLSDSNRHRVLTEAQREVVIRWAAGHSANDIAEDLQISPVAVRLRLMQARRRLAA